MQTEKRRRSEGSDNDRVNLIQSNPINLIGPISASVNGLEFDVKIGRYLGRDDR